MAATSDRAADALLASIHGELPEVECFTREDLLHLRCFDHVSTITRYQYVREAVHALIRRGDIVERSRVELATTAMAHAHSEAVLGDVAERYGRVIARHVARMDGTFGVMDVVRAWKSDPHLTVNTKRIAARQALTRMARAGQLQRDGYGYRRAAGG